MNAYSKLKSITLVLLSIFSTGCVVAVVAGAAAGMVYDRRSVATMEADARLFHVIHKKIVSNPQFSDSHLVVTSFNRVVLLAGQTPTTVLKNSAERIARSTPGVNRVYNEISVQQAIPLTQRTKDSWITSQVRSAMLTKKGLASGSIRIVTENRVVF